MDFNKAEKVKEQFRNLNILYLYSHRWFFDEDEDDYVYNFEKPGNSGMVILESDFAENVILFNSIETRKLFNNNDGLLFERSSAISDENLQYPLIITGINVFTLFGEDEESRIPSWAYIESKQERDEYLKREHLEDILYFSLDSDVFNKWKNSLEEAQEAIVNEWERIVMRTIHLKGDILITDPCYWVKDEDWGVMEWDNNFKKYGITESICRDTLYGDWSCTTFNIDTKEVLGEFCADSGMVCVCLLDEVKAYSGDTIDEYIKNGCATVIHNFDGDIKFVIENDCLKVVGCGNINFFTSQTGL